MMMSDEKSKNGKIVLHYGVEAVEGNLTDYGGLSIEEICDRQNFTLV